MSGLRDLDRPLSAFANVRNGSIAPPNGRYPIDGLRDAAMLLFILRCAMFLYLTTIGRISGEPRVIEIWFTEYLGCFYLIAEQRERASWVRNIQEKPQVKVRVADRQFDATARVVYDDREPKLATAVKALSDSKYGWSDGLVVELVPT